MAGALPEHAIHYFAPSRQSLTQRKPGRLVRAGALRNGRQPFSRRFLHMDRNRPPTHTQLGNRAYDELSVNLFVIHAFHDEDLCLGGLGRDHGPARRCSQWVKPPYAACQARCLLEWPLSARRVTEGGTHVHFGGLAQFAQLVQLARFARCAAALSAAGASLIHDGETAPVLLALRRSALGRRSKPDSRWRNGASVTAVLVMPWWCWC